MHALKTEACWTVASVAICAVLSASACVAGAKQEAPIRPGAAGDTSSSDDAASKKNRLADSGAEDTSGFNRQDGGCGGEERKAETRLINIMLVVDRSSSMNTDAGSGSRWWILQQALKDALSDISARVPLGLTLFPSVGSGCEVARGSDAIDVPIELGTLSTILDTLSDNPPTETNGGTPTTAALERVLAYYTTGAGARLEGEKLVMLATDGGPITCDERFAHEDWTGPGCPEEKCVRNWESDCPFGNCCEDNGLSCLDEGTASVVLELAEVGIPTFVIGITSTEYENTYGTQMLEAVLDDFAVRGATARVTTPDDPYSYYRATDQGGLDELSHVFKSIAGKLVTECVLELVEPPPDPALVNLYVDGSPIPKYGADGKKNEKDGWTLDPDSGSAERLVIQGEDCDVVKKGVESIEVRYGCPTVILL
ncbi:MAG: VWA domain-containing protein [Polyangiaceae bacterium]|nr:VWA domain-containing protein [Polyangiaceae bacterium]